MKGFLRGFIYAFNGIKLGVKERNFKVHLMATVLVVSMGFYFQLSLIEWALILICICLVLSAELVNTAIEVLCNRLIPMQDKQVGIIKDLAAGAVLIVSIAAFLVGCLIFGWRFMLLIN